MMVHRIFELEGILATIFNPTAYPLVFYLKYLWDYPSPSNGQVLISDECTKYW